MGYERFLALHVILIVPGPAGDFFVLGPLHAAGCQAVMEGTRGGRGRAGLRYVSQAITKLLWQPSALSCVFSSVRTTSYY